MYQKMFREALNKSARADSERFFPAEGSKTEESWLYFPFLNRADEGKDPLPKCVLLSGELQ